MPPLTFSYITSYISLNLTKENFWHKFFFKAFINPQREWLSKKWKVFHIEDNKILSTEIDCIHKTFISTLKRTANVRAWNAEQWGKGFIIFSSMNKNHKKIKFFIFIISLKIHFRIFHLMPRKCAYVCKFSLFCIATSFIFKQMCE